MKVVIVILAIIAFVACLVIGLYAGGLTGQLSIPSPYITTTPTSPSLEQHTIVLVQADDLTRSHPKLVGIWLIFYYPDYPKLTLLLLYPSMGGSNLYKARLLSQKFVLTTDGQLGSDFVSTMESFGFKSNGYLIIDNFGVAQWIDWLGGINFDEENFYENGGSVISKLLPLSQDDKNTGDWLKKVSNGVCSKIGQIPIDANWTTLLNTVTPDHFHTNVSLELMMGDWKRIKSHSGTVTCELDIPK